tara:strand:- start:11113 stop:11316 length:204 start_codon:yes stop_codon:yes gene_type:complete
MKEQKKQFVKITSTIDMPENFIEMMKGKLELIKEQTIDGMLFGIIQNSIGQKVKISAINYELIKTKK